MADLARRFGRGLAIATATLCGALPLFAQHSSMGGGGARALLMLVVLLVLAVVVLRLIVAIFRWLFKKKPVSSPPPASIPPASGPVRMTAPKSTPTSDRAIFISYRRQDSPHITGRIYDKLTSKFGKSAVFKDVENIPIGIDFRDHINKELKNCSVLLAVIGESWNPSSPPGRRRLDDPGIPCELKSKPRLHAAFQSSRFSWMA